MAAPSLKGGKTLDAVPVDEIQAAISAAEHQRVWVFLKRKTHDRLFAIAGKTERTLEDLLHPEEWILPMCGGGRYRVETMDLEKRGIEVIPPYWVDIDGRPKSTQEIRAYLAGTGGSTPEPGSGGPMYPPPPYGYPPYPYPMPSYEGGEPPDPRQFWQQPPDAVAQENTRAMRKELEKKEDEHKRERDELLKRIDKLTDRIADMQKQHAESIAKEQMARLEARIEALKTGGASTKESTTAELVKAAGLFAPVLIAMVQGSQQTKALDVQQQQKAQELQLQTLSTFMKSNAGGFTEFLKVALPALGPMVVKMFEERSPSKMAELIGTMGESNLTMFSMVGEMMRQIMPSEPDNPWMNVIQQGLDSVKAVAEQMAKVSKPGPAAQVPHQIQAQNGQDGSTPQDQAKAIADLLINEPSIPEDLRTREWHGIYWSIHRLEEPKQVASDIGSLLMQLDERKRLPAMFKTVFSDESTPPRVFLKPLIDLLPIARRGPDGRSPYDDYIEALYAAFDANFMPADEATAEVVR